MNLLSMNNVVLASVDEKVVVLVPRLQANTSSEYVLRLCFAYVYRASDAPIQDASEVEKSITFDEVCSVSTPNATAVISIQKLDSKRILVSEFEGSISIYEFAGSSLKIISTVRFLPLLPLIIIAFTLDASSILYCD